MRIAFVTSEFASLEKVGGLADVSESLPKALKEKGEEVAVFMPLYKRIKEERRLEKTGISFSVEVDGEERLVKLKRLYVYGFPVYLLDYDPYFHRDNPYGTPEGDYPDNPYRFALLSQGVLLALKEMNWQVDVIHCNDWETALVPVYLKNSFSGDPFFASTGTLFTIHNLAYQGVFPKEVLPAIGLGWDLFHMEALEYYGNVNYLKGGLVFSDVINTVSETYSREIQSEALGYGLDGVLRMRREDLYGVINGIDCDEWNPAKDGRLFANYDAGNPSGKAENKRRLMASLGLEDPDGRMLAGMVGRLVSQKGIDLLHSVLGDMVDMGISMVILGSGEERYHSMLQEIQHQYPGLLHVKIGYDDTLAARIYAASDVFLMPSRYEPCGLGQMIALRYGTIPVVRKTGGLADTIEEFNPATGEGNGFLFTGFTPTEFLDAVKRAHQCYAKPEVWRGLVRKALDTCFSWEGSATKYVELYRKAREKRFR